MRLRECAFKAILEVSVCGFVLFFSDVATTDKSLGVKRTNGALRLDRKSVV